MLACFQSSIEKYFLVKSKLAYRKVVIKTRPLLVPALNQYPQYLVKLQQYPPLNCTRILSQKSTFFTILLSKNTDFWVPVRIQSIVPALLQCPPFNSTLSNQSLGKLVPAGSLLLWGFKCLALRGTRISKFCLLSADCDFFSFFKCGFPKNKPKMNIFSIFLTNHYCFFEKYLLFVVQIGQKLVFEK